MGRGAGARACLHLVAQREQLGVDDRGERRVEVLLPRGLHRRGERAALVEELEDVADGSGAAAAVAAAAAAAAATPPAATAAAGGGGVRRGAPRAARSGLWLVVVGESCHLLVDDGGDRLLLFDEDLAVEVRRDEERRVDRALALGSGSCMAAGVETRASSHVTPSPCSPRTGARYGMVSWRPSRASTSSSTDSASSQSSRIRCSISGASRRHEVAMSVVRSAEDSPRALESSHSFSSSSRRLRDVQVCCAWASTARSTLSSSIAPRSSRGARKRRSRELARAHAISPSDIDVGLRAEIDAEIRRPKDFIFDIRLNPTAFREVPQPALS